MNDTQKPLHEAALELCYQIEKCGASTELTTASIMASELYRRIKKEAGLPENTGGDTVKTWIAATTLSRTPESELAGLKAVQQMFGIPSQEPLPTPRTDEKAHNTEGCFPEEAVDADFARGLERELIIREQQALETHKSAVLANGLYVELMAQAKSLEISRDQWKAVAERLAQWLTEIKNMPEYDQDDVHRLRHKATVALETFKQIKESK